MAKGNYPWYFWFVFNAIDWLILYSYLQTKMRLNEFVKDHNIKFINLKLNYQINYWHIYRNMKNSPQIKNIL